MKSIFKKMRKGNYMKSNTIYTTAFLVLLLMGLSCKKSKTVEQLNPVVPEEEVWDGDYELSSEIFPNPERGFMHTFSVYSETQPVDLSRLQQLRGENTSLILIVFYFDKFKDKALSATQLTLIQNNLDRVRQAGLKANLRFAYTDAMTGPTAGDAPLNIVEEHMDQLEPLLESNKDIIAFIQAGFIGAWGEWHASTNGLTTTENQRKVIAKLLSVVPRELMIQIRTPLYKQQIYNTTSPISEGIAYSEEDKARIGHHNDCFLSGGNEYGTYSNIVQEKLYISNEALYVPTGGETCPPTGGYSPNCREGQKEMKHLKWTYLNLDWYPSTINAWKASGCFEEFQRNLGYRLAFHSSEITEQTTFNASLNVKITIVNRGFAPLYNRKVSYLVLKNTVSGQFHEVALGVDIRKCKPDSKLEIDEILNLTNIPEGDYQLYLKIADSDTDLKSRSEYSIRLGNKDVWSVDYGGINKLQHQLKIINN